MKNENIILDIIYSMILISEIKRIEEFEEIWNSFYLWPTVSSSTLGEAITQITKFQKTVKGIVEKYPFAKPFFEKLLKNNAVYQEIYEVQMKSGGEFDEKAG